MTRFQVDSEAVIGATASVQATMERIQGEAGSLLSQLVGLEGSWSGAAATAFQSIVVDWRSTQQRLDSSLGNIGHALGVAGQQYAEAETANLRLFAQ
jgi:early secretory antigenic target protein ESAT-6